jgi:hypothetical protein
LAEPVEHRGERRRISYAAEEQVKNGGGS